MLHHNSFKDIAMPRSHFFSLAFCAALLVFPACSTTANAIVGTVGTASRVAIGTAGAAGTVAIKTAGMTQSVATAAATGAANGTARETGKLAVRGVAATGRAGFRAMTAQDSTISQDTLAHRAGLALDYPREDLSIGNVYEDGDRTDFAAVSTYGETANCYVLRTQGAIGNAICQPAPQ